MTRAGSAGYRLDIELRAGDDAGFELQDLGDDNQPVPLTGCDAAFMRQPGGAWESLAAAVTDAPNGIYNVALTAAQSAAIEGGTFFAPAAAREWKLIMTYSDGTKVTRFVGSLFVAPEE